jgi:hypothetical protein
MIYWFDDGFLEFQYGFSEKPPSQKGGGSFFPKSASPQNLSFIV